MVREQQPWLDVPFGEKDEAKAAGAQWDWRAKRWYAPRPGMPELARWLPVAAPAPEDRADAAPEPVMDDRAWPAGAAGEVRLAQALQELTGGDAPASSGRGRPPWRVLHAVPMGPGRGDIDHVLLGPPGLVTVNTEHHHGRAVRVDGDRMTVDREPVDHVIRAREQAERAGRLLAAGRSGAGGAGGSGTVGSGTVGVGSGPGSGRSGACGFGAVGSGVSGTGGCGDALPATGALAVVAASVSTASSPSGVLVASPAGLPRLITALPAVLADDEIDELYAVARRLGTWTREL